MTPDIKAETRKLNADYYLAGANMTSDRWRVEYEKLYTEYLRLHTQRLLLILAIPAAVAITYILSP